MFSTTSQLALRYQRNKILSGASRGLLRGCANGTTDQKPLIYLHMGPSGDCWTGPAVFAAKHLQPGYIKSFPLPTDARIEIIEKLLGEDPALACEIYDSSDINLVIKRATTHDIDNDKRN